jgi:hypothetical protein
MLPQVAPHVISDAIRRTIAVRDSDHAVNPCRPGRVIDINRFLQQRQQRQQRRNGNQ